uniref:Uncharacterized protein n=2 Tax=Mucochytrium quahogii TaxID=96639 RepID=A0A7S2SQ15_9STRA|mmetsp:Transcript_43653/g.69828  ORF Transcript_43653/g.69828 Transcript_43653/m.69828 type:complete len:1125 (+) Transcript_43653:117-3491(+)
MSERAGLDWGSESRPTDRADYGETLTSHGGTMSRLRRGLFRKGKKKQPKRDEEEEQRGKLGMIDGVFFRVLTNLFGVILFLRLGWLVAYAGVWVGIIVVVISSVLTLITALSLSAICTNGKVAAGGAYYLISRSLGPEFGASIGILFYVATSVSVSLYLLGFAETVTNQVGHPIISDAWDERLLAFFALLFCQLVCLVGVTWVIKVEKIMLFILLIAIVLFVIGTFVGPSEHFQPGPPGEKDWFGWTALSGKNAGSDFNGAAAPEPSLMAYLNITGFNTVTQCVKSSAQVLQEEYGNVNVGTALAVFFPAVTGILAGANISGDLKNPSKAIPTGTISAIIVGGLCYVMLICLFGAGFYRTTVINAVKVEDSDDTFTCSYGGLFHDSALVAKASIWAPGVYFGIYAASISSGLAALLGAPRILQALAKDRLFSIFDPLAKGVGKTDEPIRAYAVTFVIATLCIMTGDINTVAPLITTFFLASYAMVNYACFSAEESKSPGWRPTFRYFSKWLAFFGAFGCISAMLFLSAITGFITFTIGLALYKYVEVSNREGLGSASNWGPHKEAAEYNTALKSALLLEQEPGPAQVPMRSDNAKNLHRRAKTTQVENEEVNGDHTEIELGTRVGGGGVLPVGGSEYEDYDEDEDAMLHGNVPLFDTTHVKNYRPQCLVLSGPPNRRPALAVFIAGLKKARGVTVFGDVLVGDLGDPELLKTRNTRAATSYVAKYGIKAFNDVVIAPSFRTGCRSLMQLSGLGRRMRVNTIVLGFLDDWKIPVSQRVHRRSIQFDRAGTSSGEQQDEDAVSPPVSVVDYVGVIGDAFDLGLGVCILRGELNLLRSEYLTETIRTEMNQVLSLGFGKNKGQFLEQNGAYANANYDETGPAPIHTIVSAESHETVDFSNVEGEHSAAAAAAAHDTNNNNEGHGRKSARRIDVWWLVDDGGLTIMLPHFIRQAKSPPWVGCDLRVMAIGATDEEAEKERIEMAKLLKKLRIQATVSVVALSSYEADAAEGNMHRHSTTSSDGMHNITLDDSNDAHLQHTNIQKQLFRAYSSMDDTQSRSRTETYERVGKLIALHSKDALLVVVSLPVPPMSLDPEEYMQWLDLLSKSSEPPVLMVRGSQRDVVTMFS